MVTRYAETAPFFLNPDEVVVENVISGLVINKMKYGYAYCPCREVKGIPEEDANNICPCRTHWEEIACRGTCECGLFVSKTYLKTRKKMLRR
jgi:ferredoxin-thioredoxin reductase catalytic subunit